jgi:16S rRNA (cytosine967-C5)-methyltransferase
VRAARIEPQVRDALRLAAYELLFARTPARAVVHEGVESVRSTRPQAAGMANAVLRRLAEAASDFPWGDVDTDDAALARATGHPAWIVELMIGDLGRVAARAVLEADSEPGPLYLWHNPFKGTFDGAMDVLRSDGADPSGHEPPGCIVAGDPGAAVRGSAVAEGFVLVTDAAAQIAARVASPRPGDRVVDLTAGRGTKTVQLQALAVAAGGVARIDAVDLHAFKTRVLGDRLVSLGVPGVTVLHGDATDPASIAGLPAAGEADVVLVDAPCSGLGTLRRRPDRRWRMGPRELEDLPVLQLALLRHAASLVRPKGVVVYSTCSVARCENHDVVEAFLTGPDGEAFRASDASGGVPRAWRHMIGREGYFQSLPTTGGPDGHFVAAIVHEG